MFVMELMNVIQKKRYIFMHDTSLLWPIVTGALYENAFPIAILLIYALVVGQTT
jgi:hypothetical protein